MIYIGAVICSGLMICSLFLLLMGLPGTWCILLLAGGWAYFVQPPDLGWTFFALWGGIALVGEGVEFLAGHYGAKHFGGSGKGSMGGVIGALVGAILCAPLFFGLGALAGGLAGGFAGCFLVEVISGKPSKEARQAAYGVTLGRFGGFIIKMAIAILMLWHTIPILFQRT